MAIKIIDKFKPNFNDNKIADAKDIEFNNNKEIKILDADGKEVDNVQDAIDNISAKNIRYTRTTDDGNITNMEQAINNIFETMNASPLFTIIPGDGIIYNEATNSYDISANKIGNTVITIKNSATIGGAGSIYILNKTTNIQTTVSIPKGGSVTVSLGNFTISGVYSFSISGNDSYGNQFIAGKYNNSGEIDFITDSDGKKVLNSAIILSVTCGDLSLSNISMTYSHDINIEDITKNMLIASRINELNKANKNDISVTGCIEYPEVSTKGNQLVQKIKVAITTQNVYYKNGNNYISLYGDNNSDYNSYINNKIPSNWKNVDLNDLYYKYVNGGNVIYAGIYNNRYWYGDGNSAFISGEYSLADDIVTIFSTDEDGIELTEINDNITNNANIHDTVKDNIKFNIENISFITELPHTITMTTEIYSSGIKKSDSIASRILYPSRVEKYDGLYAYDVSAIMTNMSPNNLGSISEETPIIMNFIMLSSYSGSTNITTNAYIYKYNNDNDVYNADAERTFTIVGLQNMSTFVVNIGNLIEGRYKLNIIFSIGDSDCGSPYEFEFNVLKGASSSYIEENLIAYWDANNHTNTESNANIWRAYRIDNGEKKSIDYYIDLYNLDFSSNSINGWVPHDDNTNKEKPYLRFTGNSYGTMYYIEKGEKIPFTFADFLNNKVANKNEFSFEILYRTQCVGEMTACVLSGRSEESVSNPNYAYSDSDVIKANPGITISHNKAIFCTTESQMSTPITENEWKHVIFVFNQAYTNNDNQVIGILQGSDKLTDPKYNPISTMRIYVDGVLTSVLNLPNRELTEGTALNKIFNNSTQVILNGHINGDNVEGFGNCDIGFIRLYDSALDSSQVIQNYKSSKYTGNKIDAEELENITARNKNSMPTLYLIKNKNVNNTNRKKETSNTTFDSLFTITDKAESKKKYVNCTALFEYSDGNDIKSEIHNNVDVYLQGTSTLQFPIKNLRLRYYKDQLDDNNELILGGQNNEDGKLKLIPPNKKDEWVKDYIYTLKADYMESAHLNNTPTAMFYEKVVDAVNLISPENSNNEHIEMNDDQHIYNYDINGTYGINNRIGEFVDINSYVTNYGSYSGNLYKQSIVSKSNIGLESPGKSYFEFLTESDVKIADKSDVVFKSLSIDENENLNDSVKNILNGGNIYFREYSSKTGNLQWVKYDINNKNHCGKLLYKLHDDYKDAIIGFPCRVYTRDCSDIKSDDENSFYAFNNFDGYNLVGTMMFNYDKTAKAIGFDNKPIFEDEYDEYLKSIYCTDKVDSKFNTKIDLIDNGILSDDNKKYIKDDIFKNYNLFRQIIFSAFNDTEEYTDDSSNKHNLSKTSIVIDDDTYIKLGDIVIDDYTLKSFNIYKFNKNDDSLSFIYNLSNLDINIVSFDKFCGFNLYDPEKDVKNKLNNNYATIPVFYYDEIYIQSDDGEYVKNGNKYVYSTGNEDPKNRYNQYISELRSYDYITTEGITDFLRTDRTCMISCEGAVNTSYAAGTFFDIKKSYSTGYETDYIESFYDNFTETLSSDAREISIYNPFTKSYDIISPISNSVDTNDIAISLDKFKTDLQNLKYENDDTIFNLFNTYNDIDEFNKFITSFNIKSAYTKQSDGTIVFIKKSDSKIYPIDAAFILDSDGNYYLSDEYEPKVYNSEYGDILYRYDFVLPCKASSYNYVRTNSLTDILYINDNDKYRLATEAELLNDSIVKYKRELYDINNFYINDKKSYIGDSLSGSDEAYYEYIKSSFEHRYAYAEEDDKIKDYIKNNKFDLNCWMPIKRLIKWTSNICDEYESLSSTDDKSEFNNKFKTEFKKYFDFNYAAVYYLQMIFLAQVDNAGKNSMWDTWDGKKFYIRPYDMDTQCGLNNRGLFVIPPSAEINPAQSPHRFYKTSSLSGNISNYDTDWKTDSEHKRFKTYTTSSSRFWNIFYIVFKDELKSLYERLRLSGIYSYDYIIGFYKNITSNIIGESYYNYDMSSKYLSRCDSTITGSKATNDYLKLLYGNRIDQFSDWLKKRIIFCDTLFNYKSGDSLNTNISLRSEVIGSKNIAITVYSPTYIGVTVGSDTNEFNTFIDTDSTYVLDKDTLDGILYTVPLDGNNKEISIHGAGNIREMRYISSINPSEIQFSEAKKISKLDITGCTNITSIGLANAQYLRSVKISGCKELTSSIDLSNAKNLSELLIDNCVKIPGVKLCSGSPLSSFKCENSALTSMEFINLKNLKEIIIKNYSNKDNKTGTITNDIETLKVKGCPLIEVLDLRHYKSLKDLEITDCDSLHTVILSGLSSITNLKISGCKSLNILDCSESSSSYLSSLDLTSLNNLETLNIKNSNPTNGINIKVPTNNFKLKYLFASNSSLSIITSDELKNVESGTIDLNSAKNLKIFTITSCINIKTIKNLILKNSSTKFSGCTKLVSIKNSYMTTATSSALTELFKNCLSLDDISTFRIQYTGTNNISLYGEFYLSKINGENLKTGMNYSQNISFKESSKNTADSDISENKYNNQNYFVKDNTEYYYFKSNADILSKLQNKSLDNYNDIYNEYIESGLYVYGKIVDSDTNSYMKVNTIHFLDVSSTDSIDTMYKNQNIIVRINSANKYLFYRYANNTWNKIDVFYEIISIKGENSSFYRLYNKDIDSDKKIFTINTKINRAYTINEICRNTTGTLSIIDGTFDALSKVSSCSLAFYYSTAISNIAGSSNSSSYNSLPYTEFNKIGNDNSVTSVLLSRMFEGTKINCLDYRFFQGGFSKATNLTNMFNNSLLNGFIEYKNDNVYTNYRYYLNKKDDGTVTSILPKTVSLLVRTFSGCNMNMTKNDVNYLLSGLSNVTSAGFLFNANYNIKHIGNKPFKDMYNCKYFDGMFSNCTGLNIYNGVDDDNNELPEGMLNKDGYYFTLFNNNENYNAESISGLFNNCTSLTGYVYEYIFSSKDDISSTETKGGGNIKYIGQSKGIIPHIEQAGVYTETVGGCFASTKISEYDKEFIQHLPYLKDVSALFAKYTSNNSLNPTPTYMNMALSGYYEKDNNEARIWHPGIPIDLFNNNKFITNTSYMYAGNMLLYLSTDNHDKLQTYLEEDSSNTKDGWLLDKCDMPTEDYSKYTDNDNLELSYMDNLSIMSIFSNTPDLTNCSYMFANTDMKDTSNSVDGTPNSDSTNKYLKFRMTNGVTFDEDYLFRNNKNVTDISGLFENSIYHTPRSGRQYISDNFISNCTNLTSAKSLFRNNLYQKSMPTNLMFDSCRSNMQNLSAIFDGCVNIGEDTSFKTGNNAPLIAYKNLLSNIKSDASYSKIINIDTFTSNAKTDFDNFDTICEDLLKSKNDRIYNLKITKNKFNLKLDKEYELSIYNGSSLSDRKIVIYSSDTSNIISKYSSIYNDDIIKINNILYKYIENNDGLYVCKTNDGVTAYVTTYADYINKGAVEDVDKNTDGNAIRYARNLVMKINNNSIAKLLDIKNDISDPYCMYIVSSIDDTNVQIQPISDIIYRSSKIENNNDVYYVYPNSTISLTDYIGYSSDSNTLNTGDIIILPPNIVYDDSEIDNSNNMDVLESFYKYEDGIFGSMPQLKTVERAFCNCRNIIGAIPEDIFSSKMYNNRLTSLTNISNLFAACVNLGTMDAPSNCNYEIYIHGSDGSSNIKSGKTTAPNKKHSQEYDIMKYVNLNYSYPYNYDERTNTYLVPSDWLENAPNISNVSGLFEGVATCSLTGQGSVIGSYATNTASDDNKIFTSSYSKPWLIIPTDLFANKFSITNISYLFANVHLAIGNFDGTFLSNSLTVLTDAKYAFAYTGISSLGNSESIMFNKGCQNLSDIRCMFAYSNRLKSSFNNGYYIKFANSSLFPKKPHLTNGWGAYFNIDAKPYDDQNYSMLYKLQNNTGYYDYTLSNISAPLIFITTYIS